MDRFNLDKIKNAMDDAKNMVKAKMGSETERKIEEALSNKNWGASSTQLNELSQMTFDYEAYNLIMRKIWESLDAEGRQWRLVFKALTLLEHLVKNGTERVVENARDHMFKIRTLTNFSYHDGMSEKGTGIRDKSKQLLDLLNDNDAIREEREKSRKLRDKYVGIGSQGGFGGGYSGSSGYSGGGGFSGSSGYGGSSGYSGGGGGYSGGGGGYRGSAGGGYDDSRSGRYDDDRSSKPSRRYSDDPDDDDDDYRSSRSSSRRNKDVEEEDDDEEESSYRKKRAAKKKSSKKKAPVVEDDDDDEFDTIREPGGKPDAAPSLLDTDFFGASPQAAPAQPSNTFDPFVSSSQPAPSQQSAPAQPPAQSTPADDIFGSFTSGQLQQQQGGFNPFSPQSSAPVFNASPMSMPPAAPMGMMNVPSPQQQQMPMMNQMQGGGMMGMQNPSMGSFQQAPQQSGFAAAAPAAKQPAPVQQRKPGSTDAWDAGSSLVNLSGLKMNAPKGGSTGQTPVPTQNFSNSNSFSGLDTLAGMPGKQVGGNMSMQGKPMQSMQQPMGGMMSGGGMQQNMNMMRAPMGGQMGGMGSMNMGMGMAQQPNYGAQGGNMQRNMMQQQNPMAQQGGMNMMGGQQQQQQFNFGKPPF